MKTKTRFLGFLLMLSAFIALGSMSAAADDFRSKATGNWNALATWEYSTDAGLNWNPAVSLPTLTDNVISGRFIPLLATFRLALIILLSMLAAR